MSGMRIRRLTAIAIAAGCMVLGGCTPGGSETVDSTARAQASLARDVQEIQNLMSRRAFYHSAGRNDLEFALYSKRDDISWGQNQGFQIGPPTIKQYYVDGHLTAETADLERLSKLYPQLKNDASNLGAGSFVIHSLTTPIIEVAGDGQTAKGVWYTPGAIGITDAKGKLGGNWLWERYAVDFIKEDGQWHFWHIMVLTDFLTPMGMDLQPPPDAVALAPVGRESKAADKGTPAAPGGPAATSQWTVVNENYKSWAATTVPTVAPRLPEPYKTFSETFSYGPPSK
jgi:hypothetical protein